MKLAVARTWILAIEADLKRRTTSPNDVTPPSPPHITNLLAEGDDTQTYYVDVPSGDSSGVQLYLPEYKRAVDVLWTVAPGVAPSVAESSGGRIRISGLLSGQVYEHRVRAQDASSSQNKSLYSNTLSGQTSAPGVNTSWFRNFPIMRHAQVQGDQFKGICSGVVQHQTDFLEMDLVAVQWFYTINARINSRVPLMGWITAQPGRKTRFLLYNNVQQTPKVISQPQNDPLEYYQEISNSSTIGNPNWLLRRVGGQNVEYLNNPVNHWQTNLCFLHSGVNSHGRNFPQEWWDKFNVEFNTKSGVNNYFNTFFNGGVFQDVCELRPATATINNGTTTVTDLDYNGNGQVDDRRNYSPTSATAAGRWCALGSLELKARFEAKFPGKLHMPNAGRWAFDYYDGSPRPPLPLNTHPAYRKWEVCLFENINNCTGMKLVGTGDTGTYQKGTSINFQLLLLRLAITEKFLKTDANCATTGGRGGVIVHQLFHDRVSVSPLPDDIWLGRLVTCLCLLQSRMMISLNFRALRPVIIDECNYYLGPAVGTPSMGTLNETTLAWTPRDSNYDGGGGSVFYWQEYQNGLVVVRMDPPLTLNVPLPANLGISRACILPTTDTWARIDCTTYVNPVTGIAMRGQAPTVNSGGGNITTVDLAPWDAIMLRRT